MSDHRLERLEPVEADREPQLERSEPAPERDLPVAVVDRRAGLGGRRSQVLGEDAQRAEQRHPVGSPVEIAVEVDAHPLVRVGAVAVGEVEPVVDPAVLGRESGDTTHRTVDVEPHVVGAADLADLGGRIERHRRCRAVRRADEERHQSDGLVGRDRLGQRAGHHRERRVVGDGTNAVGADAGDAEALLDARVGLRRGVGHELRRVAVGVDAATGRPPPSRQDRDQRGLARRALDHPTAGGVSRAEAHGEGQQLLHPVEHQRLDLRARR